MGKLKHPKYYVYVETLYDTIKLGYFANLRSAYIACIRHSPLGPLELCPLLGNNLINKKTGKYFEGYELYIPFKENEKWKSYTYRIVDAELFLPGSYQKYGSKDDFRPRYIHTSQKLEYIRYTNDFNNQEVIKTHLINNGIPIL